MSAEREIRRRIRANGPLTFAEFMELALYWPVGGYYGGGATGAEPVGAAGDYYTSPLAHPAFGALLAVQLYQCWQLLEYPRPFYVVEPGAGNGLLCRDILAAAQTLPNGFAPSLRYLCIDRRPAGRPLEAGMPGAARVISDGLPLRGITGCVLSNELLDAFPVHQVKLLEGQLREVYIALEDSHIDAEGSLVERLGEPSTPALAARLSELGLSLAEGQTAEINLGVDSWLAAVADVLDAGFVLTIDYGRPAAELYSAELRPRGTLVTYHRHLQTDAPLRHIGKQDITAQVDFTAAANTGLRAGLTHLGYTSQRQFLRNLGLDPLRRRVTATPLPMRAGITNRSGLAALARPNGLGDFKVLAQGKGVGQPTLWGLEPGPPPELVNALPLPLLTAPHIDLAAGWPAAEQEFELGELGPYPLT